MENLLLTKRQQTTLKNMHVLRRSAILRRMRNGASFSAANKATQSVFDTVGWHEVLSRLRRARGIIGWIATVAANGGVTCYKPKFVADFQCVIAMIRTDAIALRTVACKGRSQRKADSMLVPKRKSPHVSSLRPSQAVGQLRAAMKFVAKCRRDAPLIQKNGGGLMTEMQREAICTEIHEILSRLRRFDGFQYPIGSGGAHLTAAVKRR